MPGRPSHRAASRAPGAISGARAVLTSSAEGFMWARSSAVQHQGLGVPEARRQGVEVGDGVVEDRDLVALEPGEGLQGAHAVLVVVGNHYLHRPGPAGRPGGSGGLEQGGGMAGLALWRSMANPMPARGTNAWLPSTPRLR